ncbi:MAG TPA: DNA/RNA non-specific endonuclease [Pyrinomonadaceae bacterium]|jgi:endonuclease G
MKIFYFVLAGVILLAACCFSGFAASAKKIETIKQAKVVTLVSPNIVISQVFGGGGVASASPYRNDFIEIFNRSNLPVNLSGWSVQFAYAGSSSWLTTALPNVTLAPGQYYLIQQAASSNGSGGALPSPDLTGSINMHPTDGKVALVNNTAALSGACPTSNPNIVDFVGYGAGGCFEGSAPVTGMGITVSAQRGGSGCFDSDQNSSDFTVTAPAPRNTSTAPTQCGTIAFPLSASGSANPNVATPGAAVLLTVRVTPADTPPSTGIAVSANLSNIGGAENQTFYDNGTNGDATANDNIFSFAYTVPENITGGTRNIVATITDAQTRAATTAILLNVNAPFGTDNPLLLGNPSNATPNVNNENNYLMYKPQYSLSYNRSRGTANWVAWRLDSTWLGSSDRQDDFRPDSDLPSGWYQVTTQDYSGSGYDRGHMTPSGDRTRTDTDNSATFLMTNIIPQLPANNQGPWADFENYLRTLAQQGQEIYIYAGGAGTAGTIALGKVTVPQVTWKVVLILPNGSNDLQRIGKGTRAFGIIVPNQAPLSQNAPWRQFRVTVDAIENLTGFNFFTEVPKNTQELIERKRDKE